MRQMNSPPGRSGNSTRYRTTEGRSNESSVAANMSSVAYTAVIGSELVRKTSWTARSQQRAALGEPSAAGKPQTSTVLRNGEVELASGYPDRLRALAVHNGKFEDRVRVLDVPAGRDAGRIVDSGPHALHAAQPARDSYDVAQPRSIISPCHSGVWKHMQLGFREVPYCPQTGVSRASSLVHRLLVLFGSNQSHFARVFARPQVESAMVVGERIAAGFLERG